MDFASYNVWNTWTPSFETSSGTNAIEAGETCKQRYRIEEVRSNKASKSKTTLLTVRIMEISTDEMYICWKGCPEGIPAALLRPERVQRVTRTGENTCLYETWETQAGPMAYIVKWKVASKLDAMMQGIANQLKEYMEGSMETVIAYSATKQ
jgi:hypothetical protein